MKKGTTPKSWTPQEWRYCLSCMAQQESFELAYQEFSKSYKRERDEIMDKLSKEGVVLEDILNTEAEFYIEDYIDVNVKTTKENLKQQVEKRELLRARKYESLTEMMCEHLKIHLHRLEAPKGLKKFKHGQNSKTNKEIVALISDTHIGEVVKADEVGGLGNYSFNLFLSRLESWQKGLIEYIEHQSKKSNIEKVHLAFIGDNIDGDDIYPGHGFHIEQDCFKQVIKGSEAFAKAIGEIAAHFPEIHFECDQLGGNHGRNGKKGYKPYRVNWDLFFGEFMSHKLEGFGNVTHKTHDVWFALKQIYDWNFLLVHGDDAKYDMNAATAHQVDYMMMLNRIIHYTAIGHQHSEKMVTKGYTKQFVNGDWVGGNSYSKIITKASRPSQLVMTIDKEYGVNDIHSIYFDTFKEFMDRTQKFLNIKN